MPFDLRSAALEAVSTCACESLRRTARAVTRDYERALAPSGLKATQFPILAALALGGPLPITTLAEALTIDRTTLTRNLKGLADEGDLTIGPDEDAADRRLRVVALTPRGRERLRRALPLWRRAQREVADRYGSERLEGLRTDLAELVAVCGS
jgi:DNA-binding MarR family transcriptional regulator